MLHLHAVPEPDLITIRTHSFTVMCEVIIRLLLMHYPFEYRYDDPNYIVSTNEVARCILGPPHDTPGWDRIIVEEG